MKNKSLILITVLLVFVQFIMSQEFYVDPNNGCDKFVGDLANPFKSIEKAVNVANNLTGEGTIKIRLMPGVYVFNDKVCINPLRRFNDSVQFIIEALIMPDDTAWLPQKMPVIQSVTNNNSTSYFPHAAGFYIASNHVVIRGIKFLGNPNPEVQYYYPVNQEDEKFEGLEISQCYFIAERNSAPIQGGAWINGQNVNINHCVFKECRNAILIFRNEEKTSITHNIITDAYESAFWIGANANQFEFSNNIISRCNFFWANSSEGDQEFNLNKCVITDNKHFSGRWNNEKFELEETSEAVFSEYKVLKEGVVKQMQREKESIPRNYLHLIPESIGYKLKAGIFN